MNEEMFKGSRGMAVDSKGNIYLADKDNHLIRKITPKGEASILAGNGKPGYRDGIGEEAQFNAPHDVAVDSKDNIYVADTLNNCIRKITPEGEVSTFAGSGKPGYRDGKGKEAEFYLPIGVSVDSDDNIYVADNSNRIKR